MTALTTLRDILGRATAGRWLLQNSHISAHVVNEHGRGIASLVIGQGDWNRPTESEGYADAAAIVQSISLARVVVDPETVGKLAKMLAYRGVYEGYNLETRTQLAQQQMYGRSRDVEAVLECLASLVGEEK